MRTIKQYVIMRETHKKLIKLWNPILRGVRNNEIFDTGYIYAPYIPATDINLEMVNRLTLGNTLMLNSKYGII